MSPEEKPPEESQLESAPGDFTSGPSKPERVGKTPAIPETEREEPVEALLVSTKSDDDAVPEAVIVDAAAAVPVRDFADPPPIAANLDNIAANGGAVGAFVLGIWSLAGVFITNWSIINSLLGLLLGFWGLTSRKRKMAWVGIFLCLLSIFLGMIQVSELINVYMNPVEENPI